MKADGYFDFDQLYQYQTLKDQILNELAFAHMENECAFADQKLDITA